MSKTHWLVVNAMIVIAFCGLTFVPSANAVISADDAVFYDFENQGSSPTVFDTTASTDNGTFSTGNAGTTTPSFSTAQVYQGSGSAFFPPNAGSPATALGSDIVISNQLDLTRDFDLSMAIYPTTLASPGAIQFLYSLGGAVNAANSGDIFLALLRNGSGANLYYNHGGGLNQVVPGLAVTGSWQTVEMVRTGNNVTFILNGVNEGTYADTAITASAFQSSIGFAGFGGGIEERYQGYLDNFSFQAPEPTTLVLLMLGGAVVFRRDRRRQL